jgi:hypothetical protein
MKTQLGVITAIWLALALALALPALAATTQDVTVTATPSLVSIANAPATWTLDGITGDSLVDINTVYYANPLGDTTAPAGANVVDAECRFTITNSSTVAIDLSVNSGNFTGGDAMTNSDTGNNGVGQYGAYSWVSGTAYPGGRVIMKTAASAVVKDALAALTNIKWGAEIETQTDAWGSGDAMTATMTISAVAD